MCAVSNVTRSYYDRYPMPNQFPVNEWPNFQELVRKAREYDRLTKQPDCQDPLKASWERELERVMREKYGLHPAK